MSVSNKFIHKSGAPASAAQPKRQIIEEIETRTFDFPTSRGERPNTAAAPLSQSPSPTTPVPTPALKPQDTLGKTYAETDAAYMTVDLPSRYQFYSFDHLSVCQLRAAHQAKFSRALKESKLRYTVEAISATLEPGKSAFDLTPGDFYFLMYWQRVNSFSKNPMIITAYCDNEDHNHEVIFGKEVDDPDNPGQIKLVKKDEATLRNEEFLNHTTLETKYSGDDGSKYPVDVTDLAICSKYAIGVETMRDVVEQLEFIQDNETLTEEQTFLLPYTGFLRREPGQETLAQRMEVAGQMSPDELVEMDEFIRRTTDYGVNEFANIRCRSCGASMRVKLSFDALTFLPNRR